MERLSQDIPFTNSDIELLKECMEVNEELLNELREQQMYVNQENLPVNQEFPVPALSPTDTIPSRDEWPGPFNFEVNLNSATAGKRSWVYSRDLNKVFLDISKSMLVEIKVSPFVNNLRVRALPVYSMADYIKDPVDRCRFHMLTDDPQSDAHPADNPRHCQCERFNFARHVVRSSHSMAYYDYDPVSDRHSVLVPLDAPPAGVDTTTVEYRFTCKTSCTQGMNRRPIEVVFTLETNDCQVVGRFALGVKICSCPKRDKEKEEEDAKANKDQCPGSGKRKLSKNNALQARYKKIKSENTAPENTDETNEQENGTDISPQILYLNSQIKSLETVVATQKEQLGLFEATTAEQLRQLEATTEQMRQLEARMENLASMVQKSSVEQTEKLENVGLKLDALLGFFQGSA